MFHREVYPDIDPINEIKRNRFNYQSIFLQGSRSHMYLYIQAQFQICVNVDIAVILFCFYLISQSTFFYIIIDTYMYR